MKITTIQAKWGYAFLAVAAILFLGYWWYLLEPLQAKLLEAQQVPSLASTLLRSIVVSTGIAWLTHVGFSLTAFAYQKPIPELEFKLADTVKGVFWKWALWWGLGVGLFSLFWKYGNF